MKILMISPEGPPLARAGAIVDVLDALPRELRTRGHEVSVALPFYREIRENPAFKEKDTGVTLDVRVGDKTYIAEYLEGRSASGVQLFLFDATSFSIATEFMANTASLTKTTPRVSFFSAKRRSNWRGVSRRRRKFFTCTIGRRRSCRCLCARIGCPFSTVLTIHRLAEQGSFWGLDFGLTNLHERFFHAARRRVFRANEFSQGRNSFRRQDHHR